MEIDLCVCVFACVNQWEFKEGNTGLGKMKIWGKAKMGLSFLVSKMRIVMTSRMWDKVKANPFQQRNLCFD